jgi:hypothetical protein
MISVFGLSLLVLLALGMSLIAPIVLIYLILKDLKEKKLW